MKLGKSEKQLVDRLRTVLDRYKGRYRELNGARDLGMYLARERPREDEELLTEPILADVLERLLGFPADAYFPQLGRGGLKPDFTPHDLVAHRFVLDAKSSTQELGLHEPQIRRYIDQRQLDYGVLFNLRELRVYRRGQRGHDRRLSFSVVHLWEIADGQALADEDTMSSLVEFVDRFRHQALGIAEKVELIRGARSWSEREGRGDTVEIDLDFLVDRLRDLSRELRVAGRCCRSAGVPRAYTQDAARPRAFAAARARADRARPCTGIRPFSSARDCEWLRRRRRARRAGLASVPAAGVPARAHADHALPLLGRRRVR